MQIHADGVELDDATPDFSVHVIDPGKSGADDEGWESMHDHADGTPEAVRSTIESSRCR